MIFVVLVCVVSTWFSHQSSSRPGYGSFVQITSPFLPLTMTLGMDQPEPLQIQPQSSWPQSSVDQGPDGQVVQGEQRSVVKRTRCQVTIELLLDEANSWKQIKKIEGTLLMFSSFSHMFDTWVLI